MDNSHHIDRRYHNILFLEMENKDQDVSHHCPQPKLPTIE